MPHLGSKACVMAAAPVLADILNLPKDASIESRREVKTRLLDHGGVGRMSVMGQIGVDAEGRVEAYAAEFRKFNAHNDYNLPGCFARTIAERHTPHIDAENPSRFKVTWLHGEPCALALEAREDERGLWTVSRIIGHDKPGTVGEYRYMLIREGVVDGLSIEFDWWRSEMRWMRGDEYEIEDLGTPDDWWFEPREMRHIWLYGWGFVEHPSADDARVEVVRHARAIKRDLERLLVQGFRAEPEQPAEPDTPVETAEGVEDAEPEQAQERETPEAAPEDEARTTRMLDKGQLLGLHEQTMALAKSIEEALIEMDQDEAAEDEEEDEDTDDEGEGDDEERSAPSMSEDEAQAVLTALEKTLDSI